MTRIALHAAVVLGILASVALVWQLRAAALILALALSLAAALRPAIERLVARGVPRPLALAATYLVALALFAVIDAYAVGACARELRQAGDDWVEAYEEVKGQWPAGNPLERLVARRLPSPEELYAMPAHSSGMAVIEAGLGLTLNLFHFAVELIVIFVLSIYWNIDRVYFERLWLSLLPLKQRTQAGELWRAVEAEVGAYFGSEVVQSLIAAGTLAIGYRVIGFPYPTLAALACAVAWLIPWVGIVLAVIAVVWLSLPGAILSSSSGLTTTAPAVAFTIVLMLVLEIVVEPRVFNRKRYNALLIAVVAVAMAEIVGLVGLVLGPPLAAIVQILSWHWLRHRVSDAAEDGVPSLTAIRQKLQRLRARVERLERPSQELMSFVDRLTDLTHETEMTIGQDAVARFRKD
jgi:predicted PurR-regulated permease PerM